MIALGLKAASDFDRRLFPLQPIGVERLGQIADFVGGIVGRTQIILAEVEFSEMAATLLVGQTGERHEAFSTR